MTQAAHFSPCSGCSRHIKKGDAVCPFCGAASVRISPTRVLAGRLSRAALFAAGAAVATTDCNFSSSSYGGPPCGTNLCEIETQDASASDGPTSVPPDAGATSEATDAGATSDAADASSAGDVVSSTPPYGQGPVIGDE